MKEADMSSLLRPRPGIAMLAMAMLLAATVVAATAPDVSARRGPKGIWPPGSRFLGSSYGEWAAKWWQWVIREARAPLMDETGADCDLGQSGRVWFLAGSWVGRVERECTISDDKSIFFPIQNVVFVGVPEDPWPYYPHADEADTRAYLADLNDSSGGRSATIDGEAVEDLDDYRFTSPVFAEMWPGWTWLEPCVDDGWYLMLKPLDEGEHTLHFTGWDGDQDITYYLTIVDDE
jgi:hypothetical protein